MKTSTRGLSRPGPGEGCFHPLPGILQYHSPRVVNDNGGMRGSKQMTFVQPRATRLGGLRTQRPNTAPSAPPGARDLGTRATGLVVSCFSQQQLSHWAACSWDPRVFATLTRVYFLVTKKDGGLRPVLNLRLNLPEQILESAPIQYADYSVCDESDTDERMTHIDRSEGCVLPCACCGSSSALPAVCLSEPSLPVHGAPFWALPVSQVFSQ